MVSRFWFYSYLLVTGYKTVIWVTLHNHMIAPFVAAVRQKNLCIFLEQQKNPQNVSSMMQCISNFEMALSNYQHHFSDKAIQTGIVQLLNDYGQIGQ